MPDAADWQITIHPEPHPEPHPTGYIVARFTCTSATIDYSAQGIVSRRPQGLLAVSQVNISTGRAAGLTALALRSLPVGEILSRSRAVVPMPMATAAETTPVVTPCCSCEGHPARRGGRAPLTEAHMKNFTRAYLAETTQGPGSTARLAAQYGRPTATINTWIKRARKDGWLGPGSPGRAGAEPGPRLITEEQRA